MANFHLDGDVVQENLSIQLQNVTVDDNDTDVKLRNESAYLLQFFPEEVWLMVAEKFEDPKDYQNLSNASPFFRNLLSHHRVQFLFPQVWKFIEELYNKQCEQDFKSVNNFNLVLPKICSCGRSRKSFEYSPILQLRFVCKSWCDGLDKFYEDQNRKIHLEMQHDENSNHSRKYPWTRNLLGSRTNDDQLQAHFRETHENSNIIRNPFIGKSIRIHIPADQHQIASIFAVHGENIHHCVIESGPRYSSDISQFVHIQEWLNLMPNLISLKIKFGEVMSAWRRAAIYNRRPRPREANINDVEIPTLENLEFLSLEGVCNPIVNKFIRANGHISRLEVIRFKELRSEILDIVFPMPNLTQFSIAKHSMVDMESLESQDVSWPLTKFYLDFKTSMTVDWAGIFRLVENKWADTLTDLVLQLPGEGTREKRNKITEQSISLRLNLPRVKRFKVFLCNYTWLDFILPMRNCLEKLEIIVEFNEHRWRRDEEIGHVEREQVIQFIGYSNRMYESNIWEVMSKLKKVKVIQTFHLNSGENVRTDAEREANTWMYTRGEWEAKQEINVVSRMVGEVSLKLECFLSKFQPA